MSVLLSALLATLLVSLISLIGVLFLSLNDELLNKLLLIFVAHNSDEPHVKWRREHGLY